MRRCICQPFYQNIRDADYYAILYSCDNIYIFSAIPEDELIDTHMVEFQRCNIYSTELCVCVCVCLYEREREREREVRNLRYRLQHK